MLYYYMFVALPSSVLVPAQAGLVFFLTAHIYNISFPFHVSLSRLPCLSISLSLNILLDNYRFDAQNLFRSEYAERTSNYFQIRTRWAEKRVTDMVTKKCSKHKKCF